MSGGCASQPVSGAALPPAVHACEDRVLDGPASGEKGSKGGILLDCIRSESREGSIALIFSEDVGSEGERGRWGTPTMVEAIAGFRHYLAFGVKYPATRLQH